MQALEIRWIPSDIGVSLRADSWTGRISPGALPPLEDRPQGLRGSWGGLGASKRLGFASEGPCTGILAESLKLHLHVVV